MLLDWLIHRPLPANAEYHQQSNRDRNVPGNSECGVQQPGRTAVSARSAQQWFQHHHKQKDGAEKYEHAATRVGVATYLLIILAHLLSLSQASADVLVHSASVHTPQITDVLSTFPTGSALEEPIPFSQTSFRKRQPVANERCNAGSAVNTRAGGRAAT